MPASTRDRIVEAGADLFWRQGYNATGMKQIVERARAPFGSVYHFFPGGKAELGAEVIRWSAAIYGQLVDAFFEPAPDVVTAVDQAFAGAAQTLRDTDYADACPIATVALEVSSTSEVLRVACADSFESWIAGLTRRFVVGGIDEPAARELAFGVLTLLEGAFVLSRAAPTTDPIDAAGRAADAHTRAADTDSPSARGA
jgi:AcrR family transcriptional regulator